MIIDVHAHYMPQCRLKEYSSLFELRKSGDGVDLYVDGAYVRRLPLGISNLPTQLADMEHHNIDQRFLCIFPTYFFYKKAEAIEWSRAYNDGVIQDIAPYKDKFRLLATLPMRSMNDACCELKRVMENPLVVGVEIGTNIAGANLDDAEFEPFWALAEELQALVLLHPANAINEPRLSQYYLRNIIANPLDTTITAYRLIAGGVLERHPGLSICLSHSGGFLPFSISRLDHGKRVRPELAHLRTKPSEIAKQFYYDTVVFDAECLDFAVRRLGADRFLLGSDYPFDMGDSEPLCVVNDAHLSENDRKSILGLNVSRLILRKG